MSTRHLFALIVVFCTASQLGCVCMRNSGCGGCGMGGQVYDGCASCGVPDSCCDGPSCGIVDVSCGCPDASCGCPDGCGGGVGCGAPVRARCGVLARLRDAICGCAGCGGPVYWNEWQDCSPSACDPCDCYGNYIGGPYGSPHGRRAQLAKKSLRFEDELRLSKEATETSYR